MKEILEDRKESYDSVCSVVRYMKVDHEDDVYDLFKPTFGDAIIFEFFGAGRKNKENSKT